MVVNLEEMKNYIRVDSSEDDGLISALIASSEKLCQSVARQDNDKLLEEHPEMYKIAVLYATAYLYEHREEADHHQLDITLRSLLFGVRKNEF